MKKVLLTIALAAFAFAANAQFVVGGQIDFNTTGGNENFEGVLGTTTTTYDYPQTGTIDLTIAPKIGYQLNDDMQVGLAFGIVWNKVKNYSPFAAAYTTVADFEGWVSTSQFGFGLAPYFRYNITDFGKFTLFCEAQLSFMMYGRPSIHEYNTEITGVLPAADTTYDGTTKTSSLSITVIPGLNYKIGDNFSADIYIDLLGLGFTHTSSNAFIDASTGSVVNTSETINTNNSFYLTANANAQSVNNHLNLFRIGFNYHF